MIDSINSVSSLTLTNGLEGLSTETVNTGMQTGAATPGMSTGMSFSSVLGDMATQAMDNIKQAEVSSFEGIKGTANTREVVDAVLAAEQSLQTAIALRDKIVSAYLEVSKMQI
ncbi:flagellar hook-basal body complex protein FliE [Rhizobium sp. CG5]|uniref:flagellar hook-basal body complex protein FliE n=1 Tax=Rhizobium sp. CG5 TaxID=2726076 RepID=UPI00203450DF|nr:flagellar hook-basal body complex protein FliE [Rhizobium sp. CG5]MCM2472808.1 flagellar hook-basal body complex protein FliE [Rhizobium sp. CG5]